MQPRSRWSETVGTEEAHARYLGRRRYNRLRQDLAALRRLEVAELIVAAGGLPPGVQARIARHLGVHRSTISRDVRAIFRGPSAPRCPCCGALTDQALDRLDALLEDGDG